MLRLNCTFFAALKFEIKLFALALPIAAAPILQTSVYKMYIYPIICIYKIFNKNTVKVSYSCTDNLQTIIKKHNRKILETTTNTTISTEKNCNCRKKKDCPLKNNCLTSSVIYNANVTTESDAAGMNYIGLTEGTFKQRYTQHKLSFRNRNYSSSTELSKHTWTLKNINTNYKIDWSILYSNKRKRCYLCLTEKLYLIKAKKPTLLNKRTELISKCRHENKFYLANFELNRQQ